MALRLPAALLQAQRLLLGACSAHQLQASRGLASGQLPNDSTQLPSASGQLPEVPEWQQWLPNRLAGMCRAWSREQRPPHALAPFPRDARRSVPSHILQPEYTSQTTAKKMPGISKQPEIQDEEVSHLACGLLGIWRYWALGCDA